jgi:hypothetical protein
MDDEAWTKSVLGFVGCYVEPCLVSCLVRVVCVPGFMTDGGASEGAGKFDG